MSVDGILLLDKPAGLSSNQALQAAKRFFGADKAGHTGSLDPLATGLLPICFGQATKVAGLLLGSHKAYAAECRLGQTTTTDDADGDLVRERPIPALVDSDFETALQPLRGSVVQIPPIYSAIKLKGKPLYRRARRGEDVQAPPRTVNVFRLDLIQYTQPTVRLFVECGTGTYVRSLVRDMGEALGCGAHLTALRRLWVDPFRQQTMYTLTQLGERIERGESLSPCLLPLESGLADVPAILLDKAQTQAARYGQPIMLAIRGESGLRQALDPDGRLVALAELGADGQLKPVRGFTYDAPTATLGG
jgi:tRNA pseudouridine55 synthase